MESQPVFTIANLEQSEECRTLRTALTAEVHQIEHRIQHWACYKQAVKRYIQNGCQQYIQIDTSKQRAVMAIIRNTVLPQRRCAIIVADNIANQGSYAGDQEIKKKKKQTDGLRSSSKSKLSRQASKVCKCLKSICSEVIKPKWSNRNDQVKVIRLKWSSVSLQVHTKRVTLSVF